MTSDLRQDMEPKSDVYKTLLESTRAIPWRIDWDSKRFTYIGPQIEGLLGWAPSSWVTVQDWASRIHEDDRETTVNFCVSQSLNGVDHEADYRALTKDGKYVWIRDVVHVVRKGGDVEALIGFMFDITERKEAESQIMALQKELEELSFSDSLTGVANRRRFDAIFKTEWLDARRNQSPLSLILLDVDFFKQYNDLYGHLAGDDCLKVVAGALKGAAVRPRDFVGRFGGEEFVLILPDTDTHAAETIAERCLGLVTDLKIPHEKSVVAEILTVSLGVGTIIPEQDAEPMQFVKYVDRLLYQAKQSGRNRAVFG